MVEMMTTAVVPLISLIVIVSYYAASSTIAQPNFAEFGLLPQIIFIEKEGAVESCLYGSCIS